MHVMIREGTAAKNLVDLVYTELKSEWAGNQVLDQIARLIESIGRQIVTQG